MAKSYSNLTLCQNPSPFDGKISEANKKWILLPAKTYKVLVPYPKDKELNFFQETILSLFKSGNKTVDYLSKKLLLKSELIEFIIKELEEKNYLDKHGLVTENGSTTLENNVEHYDLKVGYIFYDFIKNDFWDIFIFEDEYREYEKSWENENLLGLAIGTPGSPYKITALKIDTQITEPDINSEEILKVCRKSKRRKKIEAENEISSYSPKNISKVQYLGESKNIWIATYIFFENSDYWNVCHPFGGISSVLREKIDKEKEKNEELKELIKKLTTGDFPELLFTGKKEITEEVKEHVKKMLSDSITKYSSLYLKICEITILYNKIFKVKNSGSDIERLELQKVEYIKQLYECLEESLYLLAKNHHFYFNINHLSSDTSANISTLEALANQMGFHNAENINIFAKMFSVRKGSLDINRGKTVKELRALFAMNLLIAKEVIEHPFWTIGKRYPKALLFIYKLKLNRDENCHGAINILYSNKECEDLYNKTMYIISNLIIDLKFNINEKLNYEEKGFIDKKIYLLSEVEVENTVGIEIRKYNELRKLLIHLVINQENRDFIVYVVKVFDHLLLLIWEKINNKDIKGIINKDMNTNLGYIKRQLGVCTEELPESFRNIDVKKIYSTAKNFDGGVLSARLYCLIFAITITENKYYEKLILDNLFTFVGINDLRGHGNEIDVEKYDSNHVKNEVFDIVKKMINTLNNIEEENGSGY